MKVIFNTDKLNEKQQKEIRLFIKEKMNNQLSGLELSTLDEIIVTKNFSEDVIKAQKEYQLREVGYTNREDGIAVAKVIHTNIKNKLTQKLIINDYIIKGLLYPDKAQSCFHLLHHEFSHVHENYYQHMIFTPESRSGKNINKLERTLLYNAEPAWSEYFAARTSSTTFTFDFLDDIYLTYLFELIISCKERIENEINKYRRHGDAELLFGLLQKETSILFKIAATSQGYLDGLNIVDEHPLLTKIDELIQQTFFYDIWCKQWDALKDLYNTFPNWNDVYQLHDLGQAISICWSNLGIIPSYLKEKNSIYIDVPL